ncbi:MAG: DUF1292 domain-containing protein [Lachnospiraceae bacterium]|nr:DUF1292 domain-containing protein [Lachnospiraceae bacterium]
MEDNTIIMTMDDGTEVEFTVLESTVFGGNNYILVTDAPDDEDGLCFVMKEVSDPDAEEAVYEDPTDEEADAVMAIFQQMLEGEIDIER